MKKYLLTVLALLLVFTSTELYAKQPAAESLEKICEEYKAKEGFDVVTFGPLAMSLMNIAAKMEMDEEERDALNVFKGIKRMIVVEYENCSRKDRTSFETRVKEVLGEMELLMSMKEDGETVEIYGGYNEKTGLLSNMVMFMPVEGGLLSFTGSIDMENVAALANETL